MACPSTNTSSLNETEIPSWIRGYHVYQDTWEIEIGEVLDLIHEPNKQHDNNAIAVIKDDNVVGHAPRALASTKQGTGIICHFLTKKGSKGQVQVIGNQWQGIRDGNTLCLQVYWTAKKCGYAQQITRHFK